MIGDLWLTPGDFGRDKQPVLLLVISPRGESDKLLVGWDD